MTVYLHLFETSLRRNRHQSRETRSVSLQQNGGGLVLPFVLHIWGENLHCHFRENFVEKKYIKLLYKSEKVVEYNINIAVGCCYGNCFKNCDISVECYYLTHFTKGGHFIDFPP